MGSIKGEKKRKLLFIVDSYKKRPTANGICVEEIIEEMEYSYHMKYDIHVLCINHGFEQDFEHIGNVSVHRIKADLVNSLRYLYEGEKKGIRQILLKIMMQLINRIETVLFMYAFPMRNPVFAYRFSHRLESLYNEYHFDCVVAAYCPFESVYAANRLKEKKGVKTVLYFLDSISNQKMAFNLPEGLLDNRGWRWETKFFERSDLILNMLCHEDHYRNPRYEKYKKRWKLWISLI